MKVEREIAGFTLPFAAGILLISLAGNHFFSSHHAWASASLAACSVLLIHCIHPSRKNIGTIGRGFLIGGLALCLGIFCGECGKILSVSSLDSELTIHAERYGKLLQKAVDSIPFACPDTNAVIKALLTGEKADIPPSVTAVFRDSGASHILALSGFHLGIIYGIVRALLSVLGNRRKTLILRAAATIAACGFYTMATGAGPSIVRAFLFITLHETASLSHRYHSTGSILLAALFIQLVISPESVTSVGFQLSYAAMAGIAFIFPWLKNLWPDGKGGLMKWMWVTASMSVSCQITTGPLAYFYFGTFPQHFLLTNLIALPLTAIIIPSAILTTILHHLGICPDLVISATEKLTFILRECLEIIASL
jgi:competence protein ComEC